MNNPSTPGITPTAPPAATPLPIHRATAEPLEPLRRAGGAMHDALAALGNVRRLIEAGDLDQAAKVADDAEEEFVGEVFRFDEFLADQDAPTTDPTPAEFREGVEQMDRWSQWAFDKINALAKLALLGMESPEIFRHPDVMAETLHTIAYLAEDARNLINLQAEGVGADHKSEPELEASRRRLAAMRAAMKVQS